MSRRGRKEIRGLLLRQHQLAVLDLDAAYVVGQFHVVSLFGEALLQTVVHQRNRNVEIADLELSWVKGGVTVFRSKVSGDGDPDVLAGEVGEELAVDLVAVEADLLVKNVGHGADVGAGGKLACRRRKR